MRARLIFCTGPEVIAEATRVLQVISDASEDIDIKLETHDFGGRAIDVSGEPLTPAALKACQEADAILLGALLFERSWFKATKTALQVPSVDLSGAWNSRCARSRAS